MSLIYSKTTNFVKVTVQPVYDPANSFPIEGRYVFRYNVSIENLGESFLKILSRNWLVYDVGYGFSEVNGKGVIGLTPEIAPGETFSYFSNVALQSGMGNMQGEYIAHNLETDEDLHIAIPKFQLISRIFEN